MRRSVSAGSTFEMSEAPRTAVADCEGPWPSPGSLPSYRGQREGDHGDAVVPQGVGDAAGLTEFSCRGGGRFVDVKLTVGEPKEELASIRISADAGARRIAGFFQSDRIGVAPSERGHGDLHVRRPWTVSVSCSSESIAGVMPCTRKARGSVSLRLDDSSTTEMSRLSAPEMQPAISEKPV